MRVTTDIIKLLFKVRIEIGYRMIYEFPPTISFSLIVRQMPENVLSKNRENE